MRRILPRANEPMVDVAALPQRFVRPAAPRLPIIVPHNNARKSSDERPTTVPRLAAQPPARALRQFHRRQMAGPGERPLFRRPQPGRRQESVRDRALGRRRRRTRTGCRACRTRRLGPHRARRARPPAAEDRRPHRRKPRTARLCRDARQRQADPRDARRRRAAGRRSFPLLRRLHPRRGRRARRTRQRHRRLSLQGADGRRRPDHPVELPAADGGVEAGAGAAPAATAW